jgi:hypothetical protein
MKGVGIAFATGLLGMLVGSLAAQPFGPVASQPFEPVAGPSSERLLYEGSVEVVLKRDDPLELLEPIAGQARVYDGWVLLPNRQIIPREQIRTILLQANPPAQDFGVDPTVDRPRPRGFRED